MVFLSSASYGFRSTGFASLGRFTPRYYFFDAMVNGIVSLIFFSDISLSVYRNATDSCILILHPATLPNPLSSSSLLGAALGFSIRSIVSPANRDGSSFPFPNCNSFLSFTSLIDVARKDFQKYVE